MITITLTEAEAAYLGLAACVTKDTLAHNIAAIQNDIDMLLNAMVVGMVTVDDIYSAGRKLRDAMNTADPEKMVDAIMRKQQETTAADFPLPMGATPRGDPRKN